MNNDIIIIGAGACGLMAARELSRQGKQVLVLEARDRTGGRIHTFSGDGFLAPVELGAEFVHGNLKTTRHLVKEAGITSLKAGGKMVNARYDAKDEDNFMEGWDVLEDKMKEVKQDITVDDFLQQYFSEPKYKNLVASVKGFVEGYDAADTALASLIAFREEWMSEEGSPQHRLEEGYGRLLHYLQQESMKNNCRFALSAAVKEIKWSRGQAQVLTHTNDSYTAAKVIVTVPMGVLANGDIRFTPGLPQVQNAVSRIGYGSVIKILLEFKSAFWLEERIRAATGLDTTHMGFVFSQEAIPTWWTQYPGKRALLTGWLAGPKSEKYRVASGEELRAISIASVANIFRLPQKEVESLLVACKVVNWLTDPYALGAYAYTTVETPAARKVLNQPIEDTIYFAGEACYEGPEMGTVEAAFVSGMETAGRALGK